MLKISTTTRNACRVTSFCKDGISLYHTSCQCNETSEKSYSKNLLVRILLRERRKKSRGAKGLQLEVGAQPSSHHLLPREGLFQGLVPATSICAAELLLKGKYSFFWRNSSHKTADDIATRYIHSADSTRIDLIQTQHWLIHIHFPELQPFTQSD